MEPHHFSAPFNQMPPQLDVLKPTMMQVMGVVTYSLGRGSVLRGLRRYVSAPGAPGTVSPYFPPVLPLFSQRGALSAVHLFGRQGIFPWHTIFDSLHTKQSTDWVAP